MKITNCFWEKRNLNSEVVEITVEPHDLFSEFDHQISSNYSYLVVKVPVNMPEFIFGLSALGFTMIELQMDMSVKLKDFDYEEKLLKWVAPHVRFCQVKSYQEMNEMLNMISPGMFSTDRISLDPEYGIEVGCKRYINWISDEFDRDSSKLIWMIYKGTKVGFMMYKDGISSMRGLLGGLFKEFQEMGLGLLTPCSLPLYVKQENLPVKKIMADISSNNAPVWDLYEHFGYKATNPHYVFIKHINKL